MLQKEPNWEDGFHHSGDDYVLVIRKPGAHNITVPSGLHFLDVHIGKATSSYKILGAETCKTTAPPSTFVFLPANGERKIQATRSGWSVQMTFAPQNLTPSFLEVTSSAPIAPVPIFHVVDPAFVGIAQTLMSTWTNRIAMPTSEQLNSAAQLFKMRIGHQLCMQAGASASPANSASSRIQAVVDHIENNLADPLSLEVLAGIASISTYHFARVFRAAMGRSPHQYVVERRLADAESRLHNSDEPIAVIAHGCGFSSQSHMTDAFSKILGTTPGAVRKNAL